MTGQLQSFTVYRFLKKRGWQPLMTVQAETQEEARRMVHRKFQTVEFLKAMPTGESL